MTPRSAATAIDNISKRKNNERTFQVALLGHKLNVPGMPKHKDLPDATQKAIDTDMKKFFAEKKAKFNKVKK